MKTRSLSLLATSWALGAAVARAAMAGVAAPVAVAPSAPSAASAASAPIATPSPAAAVGPRLLTPVEQQRRVPVPQDDARREGTALPLLSFPIGKPSPGSVSRPTSRAALQEPPLPARNASDVVARCEAQADDRLRVKCRERLALYGRRP